MADTPHTLSNAEPATGRPLPPVPVSSPAEVQEAVRRARIAQVAWSALSWSERSRRLLRVRDALGDRANEIVEVIVRENGKARFEAMVHDVIPVMDLTHYFATRTANLLRARREPLHLLWPLKRSTIEYVPRGVIGIIGPWNFPFLIPMGDAIMALCAGNAAVIKPSEWTPLCALKGREILVDAGIDPDLCAVVPGWGETGRAVIEAGVDMIVFTGGPNTGKKVAVACAERLVPCVTELGGKDAVIVLEDVDPEAIAAQLVHGAFFNAGQACGSYERVLVHQNVYDRVVEHVVARAKAVRVGDPISHEVDAIDVGAIVMPEQLARIAAHVDAAVAGGARVLCGGHVLTETGGRFYAPTVLIDVRDDMALWTEETFGPLLPIMPFSSEDEAVRVANASAYGLNAYIYARDVSRARTLATRLHVGSVVVNDFSYHHALPETPWGGRGLSGIGRIHGADGLRSLCEARHVTSPAFPFRVPWTFPYTKTKYALFDRGLRRGLLRGWLARWL